MIYWNSDLRVLPGDGEASPALLAASVAGLQAVEVLEPSAAVPLVGTLPAPHTDCDRTPLSLAPFAEAGSGVSLAVEDTCGSYSVRGVDTEAPVALELDSRIPTEAIPYVETGIDWEQRWVLGLATDSVAVLYRIELGTWSSAWEEIPVPDHPDIGLTRRVLPLDATTWAVQGGGEIDLVDLAATAAEPAVLRLSQAEVELPNLAPYAGYDHLTAIPSGACPDLLVGIGTFSAAGPRRLVAIDLGDRDSGTYSATEFGPPGYEAVTVAALALGGRDVILGAVGGAADSATFRAFRLRDCSAPQEIAETMAEFDFRTPPLPGFGPDVVQPRTTGAKLVAFEEDGVATFAHYDGYDLRMFHVEGADAGWWAWQETRTIHETRTDLSVPAR